MLISEGLMMMWKSLEVQPSQMIKEQEFVRQKDFIGVKTAGVTIATGSTHFAYG
jgi:hypothetical protein